MRKRLTADNLSAAILETVQNTQIIENSRKIGTLLRDENGVENAISVIEQKTCGRLPK
jgi:UDP:flavonoid glycosyltransferase YjiC (YdhE family)